MTPHADTADAVSPEPAPRPPHDWEARAQRFQTDPSGVLLKSLPALLNDHLHAWHVAEVLAAAHSVGGQGPRRVLDLGCGYGRLSRALRQAYPEALLVGIDISATFSRLYVQEGGEAAIVAGIDRLPVRAQSVDLVLLVTTLMYLDPAARVCALRDCLAALRPGGRVLIVEGSRSGQQVYSGFGLLPRLGRLLGLVERSVETGGHVFDDGEIESLVNAAGGRVVHRRGVPAFTWLLPLFTVACRLGASALVRLLLPALPAREGTRRFSLHLAYEVARAG